MTNNKNFSFKGRKHTPETIEKIRAVHKGKIVSEESRKKMSISKKEMNYQPSQLAYEKAWESTRNRIWTQESKKKLSDSKMGNKNPQWKGDQVGYHSLHEWIKNHLPKPDLCEICLIKSPYDLANKSGKYLRDLSDWQWLCRSCHMKSDGRINNLKRGR